MTLPETRKPRSLSTRAPIVPVNALESEVISSYTVATRTNGAEVRGSDCVFSAQPSKKKGNIHIAVNGIRRR